jgi:hypothetical protein
MMETSAPLRGARGRGGSARRGHPRHNNAAWTGGASTSSHTTSDGERWERGGHRGGRARKPNMTWRKTDGTRNLDAEAGASGTEEEEATDVEEAQPVAESLPAVVQMPIHTEAMDEPALETLEERERYYKQASLTTPFIQPSELDNARSLPSSARPSANVPLRRARWTTHSCLSGSRTRLRWLGLALTCVPGSSDTGESERTILIGWKWCVPP